MKGNEPKYCRLLEGKETIFARIVGEGNRKGKLDDRQLVADWQLVADEQLVADGN